MKFVERLKGWARRLEGRSTPSISRDPRVPAPARIFAAVVVAVWLSLAALATR